MTGDPKRLLSELSDADSFERELLGSIQRVDPPEAAKGAAWARLSAQIATVGVVGAAHGNAAASVATKAAPGVLKAFGGKVAVGLALAGAAAGASALWVLSRPEAPAPRVTAQVSAQQPSLEARAPAPAPVVPESAPPAAQATPAPPSNVRSSAPLSRADRLAAESALLTQARAELRRGDANAAQQTLNRLGKAFPKGVLGQEREVLGIELLAARGNSAAARQRARAFIAAFPKSPHSAQLSRFADAP